jgi:hypothetical protein
MLKRLTGLIALTVLLLPAAAQHAMAQTNDLIVLVAANSPPKGVEKRFTAYLTGYAYWDNTPPGSAEISKPVLHRKAGGIGTYRDPITIAVGHSITGNRQTLDYAPGTRFYIVNLRKYAIVEDVCGDGRKPQAGPCHTGYKGNPWLDIYIGGAKVSKAATEKCARRITALQKIIIHPKAGYPVHKGEIAGSGCQVF